jgi:hypothetical protein
VESSTHRHMKAVVREELERDGFGVVEEPLFPPAKWISWSTYRPDLLGFRAKDMEEEVAIVECETRPSMRKFISKNYSSLWFQPSVLSVGSVRRILAVPRGKLGAVDLRLRQGWEIWVIGRDGPPEKISALGK